MDWIQYIRTLLSVANPLSSAFPYHSFPGNLFFHENHYLSHWATFFSINILKRHFLFLKLNKGFCWFRHWVLACLQPSVEICRHPPKIKCFHILHYAFPFTQNVRNSFGFFTIGQCPSTPPSCSAPLSAPVEVGYIKQFYILKDKKRLDALNNFANFL